MIFQRTHIEGRKDNATVAAHAAVAAICTAAMPGVSIGRGRVVMVTMRGDDIFRTVLLMTMEIRSVGTGWVFINRSMRTGLHFRYQTGSKHRHYRKNRPKPHRVYIVRKVPARNLLIRRSTFTQTTTDAWARAPEAECFFPKMTAAVDHKKAPPHARRNICSMCYVLRVRRFLRLSMQQARIVSVSFTKIYPSFSRKSAR